MDLTQPEYISLDCLAAKLRLPKNYLRELAKAGAIPMLHAGSRMRFRIDDVRHSLQILATGQNEIRLAERAAAGESEQQTQGVSRVSR